MKTIEEIIREWEKGSIRTGTGNYSTRDHIATMMRTYAKEVIDYIYSHRLDVFNPEMEDVREAYQDLKDELK